MNLLFIRMLSAHLHLEGFMQSQWERGKDCCYCTVKRRIIEPLMSGGF